MTPVACKVGQLAWWKVPSATAWKRQMGELSPDESWMCSGSRDPTSGLPRYAWVAQGTTLIPTFSILREKWDPPALQEVLVLAVLR